VLTTQQLLPEKVGTTSPAAVVAQSVYFACGIKAMDFVSVFV
jgi:hypothetical protein